MSDDHIEEYLEYLKAPPKRVTIKPSVSQDECIAFAEWCRVSYTSCLGGWTKENFIAVDNEIYTTEELYDIYIKTALENERKGFIKAKR